MDTLEVRYETLINDFAIVRQTTPTSLIARMKSWLVESEQFDDYWENDAPPPGVAYVHSENLMTQDNHLLFLSHAIKGMRIILHDGDIKDTILRPSHFVLLNAGVVQKGPFRAAQDCYEYIDMNIRRNRDLNTQDSVIDTATGWNPNFIGNFRCELRHDRQSHVQFVGDAHDGGQPRTTPTTIEATPASTPVPTPAPAPTATPAYFMFLNNRWYGGPFQDLNACEKLMRLENATVAVTTPAGYVRPVYTCELR